MPKKWAGLCPQVPAGAVQSFLCGCRAESAVPLCEDAFYSKCPAAFRGADAGVCRAKRRTKAAVRGERGRKACLQAARRKSEAF